MAILLLKDRVDVMISPIFFKWYFQIFMCAYA